MMMHGLANPKIALSIILVPDFLPSILNVPAG
jgi:hypothetical protein